MNIRQPNSSGFSTLMALGTIGILLIIVVGLANLYINEMRLSRLSYDDIVAYTSAEGAFEYGMLKIRNHREGFEDTMTPTDPDGLLFSLSSEKSRNMKTSYTIESASSDKTFTLLQNEHLIIPLFASNETLIPGGITSKNPQKNPSTTTVQDLSVTGIENMGWTIIAMSGTANTGLSGTGIISSLSLGNMREHSSDCYDRDGNKLPNCSGPYEEMLDYFYDKPLGVGAFLSDTNIHDPYLMIYNPYPITKTIIIKSKNTTPFTLPIMTIDASAQKNKSLQVFRFTEDRSRYYDALKYGIYNNTTTP